MVTVPSTGYWYLPPLLGALPKRGGSETETEAGQGSGSIASTDRDARLNVRWLCMFSLA